MQSGNTVKGSLAAQVAPSDSVVGSRTTHWRLYIATLIVIDIALTLSAFGLATWVRSNVPLPVFYLEANPSIPPLNSVILWLVPMWLILFAAQGLYQKRNLLGGLQEYSGVFRAVSVGILLIIISGLLRTLAIPARGWIAFAWLFTVIFVISGRFVLRRIVYRLRQRGLFVSPTLIVGANGEAASLAEQLTQWQTSGLDVIGFVSAERVPETSPVSDLPVVGSLADLERLVNEHSVEELVLATSSLTQDQILEVFKLFGVRDNVNLRLSTGLFEVISTGLDVKEVASVPLVRVNHARLTGFDWVLKSTVDIVLGTIMLIISLPLLLITAIAIKLDSPGPVFHHREVLGLAGKPFRALKFRTMFVDGDEILAGNTELLAELQKNHKLKDDPRVTRVGRFLRRSSIDELPQLWNVLRREMSLVGPRMIAADELEQYDKWDVNLLTIPPGITGLWQVSGRSEVGYPERVQLDMRYIRNWSIFLDIQIILRTAVVVLTQQGAY